MDDLSTQNSRLTSCSQRLVLAAAGKAGSSTALLGFLIIILAQCAPLLHSRESVPNRPETKVFKAPPNLVRKAVERVLTEKKFRLDTAQSNYLHIETEWLQDGRLRSMMKADLEGLPKGRSRLTLHLLLERRPLWQEDWQVVDEIGKRVYDELMEDVAMEIYRVLYEGS